MIKNVAFKLECSLPWKLRWRDNLIDDKKIKDLVKKVSSITLSFIMKHIMI